MIPEEEQMDRLGLDTDSMEDQASCDRSWRSQEGGGSYRRMGWGVSLVTDPQANGA